MIGLYHFVKLAIEAYTNRQPTTGDRFRKAGLFTRLAFEAHAKKLANN